MNMTKSEFIEQAMHESDALFDFVDEHVFPLAKANSRDLTDALVELAVAATYQYHPDSCIECGKYFNPWDTLYYRDVDDAPWTIEEGPLCGLCADRSWA